MRSSGSLQNKLLSVSLFRKNFLGAAILFSVIFFCKDDFFWKKAFAGGKGNLSPPPLCSLLRSSLPANRYMLKLNLSLSVGINKKVIQFCLPTSTFRTKMQY